MAADSASSFPNGMTYQHANKIVNLSKGLPIGAMITGTGGIGKESIDTLLKDLRLRFSGNDDSHLDWALDPKNFTMQEIAGRVREFIFEEKINSVGLTDVGMLIRLCGYSSGSPLAETWDVAINGAECHIPTLLQGVDDFGPRWCGEYEALDRLILGVGTGFMQSAINQSFTKEAAIETKAKFTSDLYATLSIPAMPIQDAIDLAKFLVETTIGFVKFSFDRPIKSVGGPIEIAAITKHEGFKWVQRKHFFRHDLN